MEVNTSVNGRMAKCTDKVLITMAKKVNGQAINTLVNLGMAKGTDKVVISLLMEVNTSVNGKMTK